MGTEMPAMWSASKTAGGVARRSLLLSAAAGAVLLVAAPVSDRWGRGALAAGLREHNGRLAALLREDAARRAALPAGGDDAALRERHARAVQLASDRLGLYLDVLRLSSAEQQDALLAEPSNAEVRSLLRASGDDELARWAEKPLRGVEILVGTGGWVIESFGSDAPPPRRARGLTADIISGGPADQIMVGLANPEVLSAQVVAQDRPVIRIDGQLCRYAVFIERYTYLRNEPR